MNQKEIKEFVENNLKDNGLVVFIRTSPSCYYCQQALGFLKQYPELDGKSVDLSETGEQQAIIRYLGNLPGSAPTFPRVFVNKELIGGYSDLEGLGASGIKGILQKA
ncbi:glutaredoxin-1 [Suillus ampliporus]|nr:glutaredoxin-1 [Suillus ampliporus]